MKKDANAAGVAEGDKKMKVDRYPMYDIYENGTIVNTNSGYVLTPTINRDGYYSVGLYKDSTAKTSRMENVHHLLAEAFIPNPHNYRFVIFADGNPMNMSLDNLIWTNDTHKLTERKIRVLHFRGDIIDEVKVFDSLTQCGRYFGWERNNIISYIHQGNIKKRGRCKGYKFEYI